LQRRHSIHRLARLDWSTGRAKSCIHSVTRCERTGVWLPAEHTGAIYVYNVNTDPEAKRISIFLITEQGAHGRVVDKALCYKSEGREFDTQWHESLNLPNPFGRTRPWGLLSL
jgi:hypothetical protein